MIKQFLLTVIANRFSENTTIANLLTALVGGVGAGVATGEPVTGLIVALLHIANAFVPEKTNKAIETIKLEDIK
jgi:hypothetical protein